MIILRSAFLVTVALLASLTLCPAQGSLTPTEAPGPTMKTLSQVEPRTLIASVPFVISQPGSYYLTANVTGAAGQDGITVNADDVTIDLEGFTVSGISGSLNGIQVGSSHRNVSLLHGNLRGWGGHGANLGTVTDGRVNGLVCLANGGAGLVLGNNFYASQCSLNGNSTYGLQVIGSNGRVEQCHTIGNALNGFRIEGTGNLVVQNSAANNAGGDYSVLPGNSYGQVVPLPGPGFITGSPWANFGGCPQGLANCAGACLDVSLDAANCGACNHACSSLQSCIAGSCVDPTCSDGLKNGAETDVDCGGGTCSACANGNQCLIGTDCLSGSCIGNVCTHLALQGAACTSNTQCSTGFCVDGFCCNTPCNGVCMACSAAKTSQLAPNGMCVPIKEGTDPDTECGGKACNGAGACQ